MSTGLLKNLSLSMLLLAAAAGTTRAQTADAPLAPDAPAAAEAAAGTITMHLQDALPEDLFSELTKQYGVKFYTEPGSLFDEPQMQRTMSMDMDKQAFWPAMKQICDATGIYPQNNYSGNNSRRIGLGRNNPAWAKRPFCMAEQFMITADQISRNRSKDIGNEEAKGQDNVNLQMTVYADPKLRLGKVSSQLVLEEIIDENGLSLLSENNRRDVYYGSDSARGFIWSLSASFNPPAEVGKKIASFKGSLRGTVYVKTEKWEVANILQAQNESKEFGTNTYTIKKITPQNEGKTYMVELEMKSSAPNEADRVPFAANNTAQLVDAKGALYQNSGGGGSMSPQLETYTINFYSNNRGDGSKVPGVPVKFVLEVPTEVKQITIPVTFTDLPMP